MNAAQVDLRVIGRQFAQDFLAIHLEATTGKHATGDRHPICETQVGASGAIGSDVAGIGDGLEPKLRLLHWQDRCIARHFAGPATLRQDHELPAGDGLRRTGKAKDSNHKSDRPLHGTGASMASRRKAIALEASRPNR